MSLFKNHLSNSLLALWSVDGQLDLAIEKMAQKGRGITCR